MAMAISKHARERYAERIMGRDTKTDVSVFIRDHLEKIDDDITKMVQFGTMIYSGRSTANENRSVDVFIKDLWVILVDTEKKNVITLYKIDLGMGEDLDKMFMERGMKKVEEALQQMAEQKEKQTEEIAAMRKIVEENKAQITEYRSYAKKLEEANEGYNKVIQAAMSNTSEAEMDVKQTLAQLVGRKTF